MVFKVLRIGHQLFVRLKILLPFFSFRHLFLRSSSSLQLRWNIRPLNGRPSPVSKNSVGTDVCIHIYVHDLLRLPQVDSVINDLARGAQTHDDAVHPWQQRWLTPTASPHLAWCAVCAKCSFSSAYVDVTVPVTPANTKWRVLRFFFEGANYWGILAGV